MRVSQVPGTASHGLASVRPPAPFTSTPLERRARLHDLRASLAGIAAAAGVLSRHSEVLSAAQVRRLAAMIESEVQRLERLVSSERTDHVRPSRPIPAAAPRPMEEVLDTVITARRLTGQPVEWTPSGASAHCASDVLAQVVNTLLVNVAVHAPHARARVESGVDQGRVRVSVADDGPGVPVHLRPTLFEPGPHRSGSPGEGLGLWMAHLLLTRHGGTLELAPPHRPGAGSTRGATFTLTLPAIRPEGTPDGIDTWPDIGPDTGPDTRSDAGHGTEADPGPAAEYTEAGRGEQEPTRGVGPRSRLPRRSCSIPGQAPG